MSERENPEPFLIESMRRDSSGDIRHNREGGGALGTSARGFLAEFDAYVAGERARALREAADALDDACAHSTDPCFCNNTNRLRDCADRIANQGAR